MIIAKEIRTAIAEFVTGLKQGCREGVVVFLSPVITLARHWRTTTESLVRESHADKPVR